MLAKDRVITGDQESDRPIAMSDAPVIVIGGGPSGVRAAECLAAGGVNTVLFNAERWQPYNRVKLTPLLSGDVQLGQVYLQPNFPDGSHVKQYSTHPIVAIDRENKSVIGQFDRRFVYSKLIIATGSRAHIPAIEGIGKDGVYKFRNFDDVEKLIARSVSARRCVVIGGGLLGLEAARGMAGRKVKTIVVEHESRLMARQLDDAGGAVLKAQIEALDISVHTGVSVKEILGESRVAGVLLSDGTEIVCDTLIVCTGIRPNMEIARDAGLVVHRGIAVDEHLQTSDPDIYAIGECAEFQGHLYGLVGPGLEQASLAVSHMFGGEGRYYGSLPTTKLKVVGSDVFSMGDVDQLAERIDVDSYIFEDQEAGLYRRLVLHKGRLVGAMAIGDWPEINLLQNGIVEKSFVWPWQGWRFKRTGLLYGSGKPQSVVDWPSAATVCNCTGVTRGQIGEAITFGANSLSAVRRETSASTVCGSCKPLIHELLEGKPKYEAIGAARPVAVVSVLAVFAALIALVVPGWPTRDSVVPAFSLDQLWTDGFYKQVSGFTLLGISVLAALISLRKNIKFLALGSYAGWRLFHVVIGALGLGILFLHTGFHLGDNLNFWLMMSFLSLAFVGALTGILKAGEHYLLDKGVMIGREAPARLPFWLHIFAFWPLPVLLALHIFTVYYY